MKIYRDIAKILWHRGLIMLGFISLYPIMSLYVKPEVPMIFAVYIMGGGSMVLYAIYIMLFHYTNKQELVFETTDKGFCFYYFLDKEILWDDVQSIECITQGRGEHRYRVVVIALKPNVNIGQIRSVPHSMMMDRFRKQGMGSVLVFFPELAYGYDLSNLANYLDLIRINLLE